MSKLKKVIRDGKVAVLYSPGYGAGWFSWNGDHPQCLFSPEIVAKVEARERVTEGLCRELFGERFYAGGTDQLRIVWVDEGEQVLIEEYDGNESVRMRSDGDGWVTV